jgi:hypothetical protein
MISSVICQRRRDPAGSNGSSCRYAFGIAHSSHLPVRFRDVDFRGLDQLITFTHSCNISVGLG